MNATCLIENLQNSTFGGDFATSQKIDAKFGTINAQDFILQIIVFISSSSYRETANIKYFKAYFLNCFLDGKKPHIDVVRELESFLYAKLPVEKQLSFKSSIRSYYEAYSTGNIVFIERNKTINFEINFTKLIFEKYGNEMTSAINQCIDQLFRNPRYTPHILNDLDYKYKDSFGHYHSHYQLYQNMHTATIAQKLSFIHAIFKASEAGHGDPHSGHVHQDDCSIGHLRSRGKRRERSEIKKTSQLGLTDREFDMPNLSTDKSWIAGGNTCHIDESKPYFKLIQSQGKYYVAGASQHTIDFYRIITNSNYSGVCLDHKNQVYFMLAVIGYLVLGGHHSLNEIAQALYYNFNQTYSQRGFIKLSDNSLPSLVQLKFSHNHLSEILKQMSKHIDNFSDILDNALIRTCAEAN